MNMRAGVIDHGSGPDESLSFRQQQVVNHDTTGAQQIMQRLRQRDFEPRSITFAGNALDMRQRTIHEIQRISLAGEKPVYQGIVGIA